MKDIRIIPDKSGNVDFSIIASEDDSILLLLQRLYIVMFSGSSSYRTSTAGSGLLYYLEGGNIPATGILDTTIALACSDALQALDDNDRSLIESFSGISDTEADVVSIVFTLTLKDGTTITGRIENVL